MMYIAPARHSKDARSMVNDPRTRYHDAPPPVASTPILVLISLVGSVGRKSGTTATELVIAVLEYTVGYAGVGAASCALTCTRRLHY